VVHNVTNRLKKVKILEISALPCEYILSLIPLDSIKQEKCQINMYKVITQSKLPYS